MDSKITALLRVTSCTIKNPDHPKSETADFTQYHGETVEVRATGSWNPEDEDEYGVFHLPRKGPYPMSLHIIVYPGCGAIPVIGDKIKVTIDRP